MSEWISTCEGQYGNGFKLRLVAVPGEKNIDNNTTSVYFAAEVYAINGNYSAYNGNQGQNTATLVVDGTTIVSQSLTMSVDTAGQLLFETTLSVPHNADGTKSISCSASFTMGTSVLTGGSVSGSMELPTIARESSFTFVTSSTADAGGSITISIDRKSPSFTHVVIWTLGTKSKSFNVSGTSHTFVIPMDFLSVMPDSEKMTGWVTVRTMNGGTQVGAVGTYFHVMCPASVVPGVPSMAVWPVNEQALTNLGLGNHVVQNLSKVYVRAQVPQKDYVTLQSVIIEGMGYKVTGKPGADLYLGIPRGSGKLTLTFTAKDTRKRETKTTIVKTVEAYEPPSIASISLKRCLQDGSLSETNEATYGKLSGELKYTPKIGSATGTVTNNPVHLTLSAAATGGTVYIDETITADGSTFSKIFGGSFESSVSYPLRAKVVDAIGKSAEYNISLNGVEFIIHMADGGQAVTFGGVCTPGQKGTNLNWRAFGKGLLDFVYPVGSIYATVSTGLSTAEKMNAHFGGTWVAFSQGRSLVGVGTGTDANGMNWGWHEAEKANVGEYMHTITAAEAPAHRHREPLVNWNVATGSEVAAATTQRNATTALVDQATGYSSACGGGQKHNNIHPVISVYYWKRIA